MNADDIIFAIERQWKESNPYFKVTSSNHSYFNDMGMPKLLKSVEKVDDYTVKFTLNAAEAPFLADLAMEYAGIQSKEYADAMLKAGTPEKIDQEPIGTGPFMLVQYQKDAIIRYKAFPDFWAGKAKIDDLIFAITPDASVRWAKLQKGECHVMPYPNPADLDAIRKDANVTVLEQPGLNIGYLAYNTTKKPFDDVRVRKAFNMAINKQAIIDAVYLSTGVAAKNPIPPTMWSYNEDVKDDPYNPDAAKKLLAEAGFPNGLETDLWAMPVQRPYNPNAKRIAELMQADLAKIGVKAEIKSFEWGEYRKRAQAGEHQTGSSAGPATMAIRTTSSTRCSAALGREVERLEHRQVVLQAVRRPGRSRRRSISDQAERTKLYEQAQVIFKEQAPWFTIAHSVQLKPVRKEVVDFKLSPFGRHTFYGVDIKIGAGSAWMLRFLLTRVSLIVPTFIGITLLAFVLIRLIPGDPIETMAGERGIDAARHERLRHEYGFDQPVLVQYWFYLLRLLQGDLGKSIVTHKPVITEFLSLFPATIELALCAILFALSCSACRPASSPRCGATRSSITA